VIAALENVLFVEAVVLVVVVVAAEGIAAEGTADANAADVADVIDVVVDGVKEEVEEEGDDVIIVSKRPFFSKPRLALILAVKSVGVIAAASPDK